MAKHKRRTYNVVRRDQIEAMASPVRLEIIDAVRLIGPCSVSDMAALVGRTADSLYFHVRRLVQVGLLLRDGQRPTSRRQEAVYRTPARRIRLPHDLADRRQTLDRLKVFGALLRLAQRDHERACKSGLARVRGPRRNVINGRIKGWLDDKDAAEVRGLADRIVEIFEASAGGDARDRELCAITILLTPIEPRRRIR